MPKYEVSIDVPNRPKGDPIEVPPVGVIENGKHVVAELTEEEYDRIKNSEDSPVKIKHVPEKAKVTAPEVGPGVGEGGEA
jgi:hypothetical protein